MVLRLRTNEKLKNNPNGNINLISIFSAGKENHRNPLANVVEIQFGVMSVDVPVVLNCSNEVKNFLE